MKTLIVGMGLVGTMHGWALDQAGVDVTYKVRPGRAKDYAGGMELDVLDTRGGNEKKFSIHYTPGLTEQVSPADGYELVMVPTKHYQAADAAAELKNLCPDAQFLLFTANWRGPGEIDAILDRSRYLWGYSACSGGYDGSTIAANLAPVVRLGEWEGKSTSRFQSIIDLFGKAGFEPDIKQNMIEWLWVHQAINSGMIGSGLYAQGLKNLAGDREILAFMMKAVREGLSILAARGVGIDSYPDAKPFLEQPDEELIDQYYHMFNETLWGQRAVQAGHFDHSSREMKAFFCEVYQTGRELGVETPLMDKIEAGIGGC